MSISIQASTNFGGCPGSSSWFHCSSKLKGCLKSDLVGVSIPMFQMGVSIQMSQSQCKIIRCTDVERLKILTGQGFEINLKLIVWHINWL